MLNPKGLSQLKFMGLVLLLLGWFCFGAAPLWADSNQEWIELTPGMDKIPKISVLESDFQQVILDLRISGIWSEEVSTKGGIFNRISIPEYGVTNVIGEPNLPVIRKMVQIPYGAEVKVEVIWSKYVKKSLQELGIANRIIPVQPPIPKIEGAAEAAEFVIHEDVYQTDGFFQQELTRIEDVGIIRGHRFAMVEISPVSYNPVSGDLRLFSQVRVRVNLNGSDMAKTQAMLDKYASPPFEEICNEMFVNYSSFQSLIKGLPTLPIGYLIIVHEDFQAQAAPLAEWKRKKGFHVTLNVIGDGTSTTTIKNYIQDAYDNWPIPPTYVLFFGDVGWIPTYTGSFSYTATDLYYVQMDGDIFADILRARFPVRSTTEATDMVTKLLYYENPTSPDLEWMRHELFIASSDHASLVEATHGWAIVNYLIPMGIYVDSLWERLGGVNSTAVTNSINAGKAIVCYSGHGASSGWQTGSYDQSDVRNLNNANEYPLVLSHACSTNPFDMTECFGETWVKVANKGGIAFWGASNSSYWDEDDILERRMWDAAFAETCYTAAAMTDKALLHLAEHYGANDPDVKYYFDMYNVNGDPSVDIWTYLADDMIVTFPGTIPMLPSHAVEINVATQDKGPLYGALVCLRKGAEVFETGYTDASGNLTLYVSPASLGNMELTVTAHNQLPFESYISVIPAGDAYLVFESQSVDDDSLGESLGDGDGDVDFAETVEFLVELKNFGDSAAHNTYGIISTTSPYITVVNDSAFWGEVPPGGTATCVNAFVFSVDPNVPDMEMVTFQLDIQATNGSWTYDDISVVVHSPILVYKSKITEDLGGNDNGKPDPGESTDITITLQNDGSAGVIQVTADLVCVDPYITVDVASASYPDMSSGGTGTALSAYRFTADEECPDGYKVSMTLQISGCGGYYTEEIFEIRIGQRPILFVDDDGGDSHEGYMMEALDSVGVLYDVWTHETDGCPPDTIFEQYQSVVWSTGDDYGSLSDPATLDSTDEVRLMTYLDNGGSLLLSSQDLLLDHNPDAFITDYLHVAGHNDDEGVTSVSGVTDDTVSHGMAFGLSYPFYNFSDHVFPGAEAAGIFYETSKGSALPRAGVQIDEYAGKGADLVNYCALRYPASGPSVYKVAFFTFAIEAVPESGTYPNNRYALMRRIMNWFGIGRTASEVMHGDANGDQLIDVGDVVFLINYLYKGDIPPAPWEAGDASCDGEVDLGDVVYLINYLYKGGDPPPC